MILTLATVEYPNLQSRLLFGRAPNEQFMILPPPSQFEENFLLWYEHTFLKVDLSAIKVKKPIILLGLHRSGTSMLQDILCCHPEIAYITNTMQRFPPSFCAIEDLRQRFHLNFRMERYLEDSVEVEAGSPNEGVSFWQKWLKEDPINWCYEQLLYRNFSAADLEKIDTDIRKIIWCFGGSQKRFFNKNPRLLPHFSLLQKLFPDAKFIHLVRDPRMCCNSLVKFYRKNMQQLEILREKTRLRFYYDLQFIPYPLFPHLMNYIDAYGPDDIRTTAHLWCDSIASINESKNSLIDFYEVRYEDILENPTDEVLKVLNFCELSFAKQDNYRFWQKISKVGETPHKKQNKYGNFEIIEEICSAYMEQYSYVK